MKKASDKWYFTKETNAKGLCYIYAYQTQWDPVAKKSKRSARKYVGRLAADSVVNITAKFRTEFPQYAQGTFYFGLDKTLVDEAAYRRDFPDAPGPKPAGCRNGYRFVRYPQLRVHLGFGTAGSAVTGA